MFIWRVVMWFCVWRKKTRTPYGMRVICLVAYEFRHIFEHCDIASLFIVDDELRLTIEKVLYVIS